MHFSSGYLRPQLRFSSGVEFCPTLLMPGSLCFFEHVDEFFSHAVVIITQDILKLRRLLKLLWKWKGWTT